MLPARAHDHGPHGAHYNLAQGEWRAILLRASLLRDETWRMPEGGVANKYQECAHELTNLNQWRRSAKNYGVTPLICVLFTYTLL